MEQALIVTGRATRTCLALLALVWLSACAKSSPPSGGVDGESHFLMDCERSCPDGLTCLEGVCTAPCDGDDACRDLSAAATCVEETGRDARCDVACDADEDCEALGERLSCSDAFCRAAAHDGGGGDGDAGGKRTHGEPCSEPSQCASGVCQGMGCDEDGPGTCLGGGGDEGGFLCTADAVTYCGCDGVTFVASGTCPGKRFSKRGACEECRGGGHYQAGKEGSYLPCCEGLTEVSRQMATTRNGEAMCVEPLGHREYACVAGTCGDGECELGEDGACGCEADCPAAAITVEPGLADYEPCESSSECRSGVCEGLGCSADQPGACAARDRACTDDLVEYCGCDGNTFQSSGSCPGRRYAHEDGC